MSTLQEKLKEAHKARSARLGLMTRKVNLLQESIDALQKRIEQEIENPGLHREQSKRIHIPRVDGHFVYEKPIGPSYFEDYQRSERHGIDGLNMLLREIAYFHDVSPSDIFGRSRKTKIAAARQEYMYALHRRGLSSPHIGKIVGRDHTTVLHAIWKWTRSGKNGQK